MIAAAHATFHNALSIIRTCLDYVVVMLVLLAQRWSRLLTLQGPDATPANPPPCIVVQRGSPKEERQMPSMERAVKRRVPASEQKLPRTLSTRRAPHLSVAPQTHRRCTSSSGVTTTTSSSTSFPSSFAAKLQPPPNVPTHTSLSEREPLAVALRCAIVRKEVRSIQALLRDKGEVASHILTHWSDPLGSSIIHTAAATADAAVMEEVLAHIPENDMKSVVNCQGPQNQTALHIACSKQALSVCRLLLKNGADPNSCTRLDTRPLHLATGVGDWELCKLLLEFGADTDCLSKVGNLPILTSVSLRHKAIVRLLLQYGANPEFSAQGKLNARAMAQLMNEEDILEIIDENIRKEGGDEASGEMPPFS